METNSFLNIFVMSYAKIQVFYGVMIQVGSLHAPTNISFINFLFSGPSPQMPPNNFPTKIFYL